MKYHVEYNGKKDLFKYAEDFYEEGSSVRLIYDLIATDTNYSFYVNEEKPHVVYENYAFVIEFVMPDHDVEIRIEKDNTTTKLVNKKNKESESKIKIKVDNIFSKVTCPYCKCKVPKIRYCTECGAKLNN